MCYENLYAFFRFVIRPVLLCLPQRNMKFLRNAIYTISAIVANIKA